MYCTSTVLANERSVQLPGQMDETSMTPIATEMISRSVGASPFCGAITGVEREIQSTVFTRGLDFVAKTPCGGLT